MHSGSGKEPRLWNAVTGEDSGHVRPRLDGAADRLHFNHSGVLVRAGLVKAELATDKCDRACRFDCRSEGKARVAVESTLQVHLRQHKNTARLLAGRPRIGAARHTSTFALDTVGNEKRRVCAWRTCAPR